MDYSISVTTTFMLYGQVVNPTFTIFIRIWPNTTIFGQHLWLQIPYLTPTLSCFQHCCHQTFVGISFYYTSSITQRWLKINVNHQSLSKLQATLSNSEFRPYSIWLFISQVPHWRSIATQLCFTIYNSAIPPFTTTHTILHVIKSSLHNGFSSIQRIWLSPQTWTQWC